MFCDDFMWYCFHIFTNVRHLWGCECNTTIGTIHDSSPYKTALLKRQLSLQDSDVWYNVYLHAHCWLVCPWNQFDQSDDVQMMNERGQGSHQIYKHTQREREVSRCTTKKFNMVSTLVDHNMHTQIYSINQYTCRLEGYMLPLIYC